MNDLYFSGVEAETEIDRKQTNEKRIPRDINIYNLTFQGE